MSRQRIDLANVVRRMLTADTRQKAPYKFADNTTAYKWRFEREPGREWNHRRGGCTITVHAQSIEEAMSKMEEVRQQYFPKLALRKWVLVEPLHI